MESRNTEVERRLAKLLTQIRSSSPKNSSFEAVLVRPSQPHQPPTPSQDQKRYPKLRDKSECKRGGQRGHKGQTLEFVNDSDKVVNCRLETEHCSCGHPLTDLAGVPGERAQVFELPRLRLEITEYQREVKVCPGCQQVHRGRYPAGVSAGASYGANYQGLMSYLLQRQFILFERLADLSHELLGHRPNSTGCSGGCLSDSPGWNGRSDPANLSLHRCRRRISSMLTRPAATSTGATTGCRW